MTRIENLMMETMKAVKRQHDFSHAEDYEEEEIEDHGEEEEKDEQSGEWLTDDEDQREAEEINSSAYRY